MKRFIGLGGIDEKVQPSPEPCVPGALRIADEYAAKRVRDGAGPVKGVQAVVNENPYRKLPKRLDPLPLCSTVRPEIKREFLKAHKAYVSSYYFAKGMAERHKDSRPYAELIELFPPGCCVGHLGWRKADA